MDAKTYSDVHATIQIEGPSPGTPMWYERRIRELEKKNEQLEMVASYAKDVIDFWPSMTFRTIRFMIPKMDSLKQALGLAGK